MEDKVLVGFLRITCNISPICTFHWLLYDVLIRFDAEKMLAEPDPRAWINLQKWSGGKRLIKPYNEQCCMVANNNTIYLIQSGTIYTIDISNVDWTWPSRPSEHLEMEIECSWTTEPFVDVTSSACALNEDTNWIYVFPYQSYQIYK